MEADCEADPDWLTDSVALPLVEAEPEKDPELLMKPEALVQSLEDLDILGEPVMEALSDGEEDTEADLLGTRDSELRAEGEPEGDLEADGELLDEAEMEGEAD